MNTVGIVGIGAMGMAMARNLLVRGHDVGRRNVLAGINLVAGAEALALAASLGMVPRAMFEIVNASSGAPWVFEHHMARALAQD